MIIIFYVLLFVFGKKKKQKINYSFFREAKKEMDEYIEIKNHLFQLVGQGEWVRWRYNNEWCSGGEIKQIGCTSNGRKNWRIKGYKGEFTLYWDLHETIMLRKSIFYEVLRDQIQALSLMMLELTKKLEMQQDYFEINKKITAGFKNKEQKKKSAESTKRDKLRKIKSLRHL